jgi:hypothetical protein
MYLPYEGQGSLLLFRFPEISPLFERKKPTHITPDCVLSDPIFNSFFAIIFNKPTYFSEDCHDNQSLNAMNYCIETRIWILICHPTFNSSMETYHEAPYAAEDASSGLWIDRINYTYRWEEGGFPRIRTHHSSDKQIKTLHNGDIF